MVFDSGNVEVRKRSRLPHWDAANGIYFVTFNLFDALPEHVRLRIRAEADAQLEHIRHLRGSWTIAEKVGIENWMQVKLGEALDHGHGACFLRDTRVAKIVANAITFFDEERYRLLTWTVMPNHAHVVMDRVQQLDRVLHSWKSFTAKRANALLRRSGHFWGEGYFDRCVRDERELQSTVAYVLNNPSSGGLSQWPFVRSYPERLAELGMAPDSMATRSR